MKNIFDIDYHPQLINMLKKTNVSGAIASNIIIPLVVCYIFYGFMPQNQLVPWLLLHFIVFAYRVYLTKQIDKKLKTYFLLISFNSFLYAVLAWQSVLYAEDIHILLVGMIIASIVAGSLATLVSVYHIFTTFVTIQMLGLISAFIYLDQEFFYLIALLASALLYIVLSSGYRQYNVLKEMIDLKESFESRVNDSTIELKNKNIELVESLHNFQDLLDTTMEMIILYSKDRKIININLSGAEMLGYDDRLDIIGEDIYNFLPDKEHNYIDKTIKYNLTEPCEINFIKKDGTEFPTFNSTKMILWNNREIIISTVLDLTTIRDNNELMQKQSRLAQMGEMISMIAHQWRQPLGAIAASAIDLRMKLELDYFHLKGDSDKNKCEQYFNNSLSNIEGFVQTLSSTIDDFRNFYKPNKKSTSTTINGSIKKSLNVLKSYLESSNVELSEDYSSNTVLNIYENEMMQVILNILKNTQDNFIDKNVKNTKINIKTYDTQENVIIEISDNGGGIPMDIIDNIFDPYFSTKNEKMELV